MYQQRHNTQSLNKSKIGGIDNTCLCVCVCVCVQKVPVVALAIIFFDIECDSEGIEVAVGWSGQDCVPDVCGPRQTAKSCGKAVQDTAYLRGRGRNIQVTQKRFKYVFV